MGCDIHAAVVYKEDGYNNLSVYCTLDLPRNYAVFSALAGVRGNLTPKVKPRGLPLNLEYVEEGTFGDHTFSWLTLDEYKDALDRIEKETDYGVNVEYLVVISILEKLPNSIIVFGFDS